MQPIMNVQIKKYIKASFDTEMELFKNFDEENADSSNLDDLKKGIQEDTVDWSQIYSILIEFLVKCNKTNEIQVNLKSISEEFGHVNEYYSCLKPYLQKNKIYLTE